MKITICSSLTFYTKMLEAKKKLESLKHEVKLPLSQVADKNGKIISIKQFKKLTETKNENWVWQKLGQNIKIHFEKIKWADAILVLNYDKNSIKNYIGGNTLIEIAFAFILKKKIFLLNPIPKLSYSEEIKGMQPIILNNDLTKITNFISPNILKTNFKIK